MSERRRPARLVDVAAAVGVDASTVSRVLRGDLAHRVPEPTRVRIISAADRLGYRGDSTARALRTRRTEMIGLVVPDLGPYSFAEVTHGVQAAARAAGFWVLLLESGEHLAGEHLAGEHLAGAAAGGPGPAGEELYERLVAEGRVDGLIIASATLDAALVRSLAGHGVPLVVVNRSGPDIPSVTVDDAAAAALAVRHLVDLGHRRIGQIAFDLTTHVGRQRDRGFRDAVAATGLPLDERWVALAGHDDPSGEAAVARITALEPSERPTALFVASLLNVVGVVGGLRAAGIGIPAGMSLVVLPDHPLTAHFDPPLSAVSIPLREMGEGAAEALIAAIHGQPARSRIIERPPELVVRRSSAPPP